MEPLRSKEQRDGGRRQQDLNLHVAAVLQLKQGHYKIGLQIIQKALGSNPDNPVFYLDLSEAYLCLGRRNDAFAALQKAAELAADDPEKRTLILLQMARWKFEEGKPEVTIELCSKIIGHEPAHLEARGLLASCYIKLAKIDKALVILLGILSSDPDNVDACCELAYCYHQTGDAVKSFSYYQQAIKTDPHNLRAYLGQGNLLKEAKQPLLAVQSYQNAIKIDPANQLAHTNTILVLCEMGKYEEATSYYREISALPLDAQSSVTIAQSLKDGGAWDCSLEALTRALKLNPSHAPAYLAWGDLLTRQKRYHPAIEKYRQAAALAPGLADVYSALGHTYKARVGREKQENRMLTLLAGQDLGELDQCVAAYQKAVECDPTNPTLVFNLAQGLEYVNQYEAGITTLTKYLAPLTKADMTTVNHHAIYILLVKLLFVTGTFQEITTLIESVLKFPPLVVGALQQIKTHWYARALNRSGLTLPRAYFFFISNLLTVRFPPPTRHPPLFIIGDSHCLSPAWHPVTFRGQTLTVVPKLITGLKAYHLKKDYQFLTVSNLHVLMASLPPGTREAIFVCGEIDCRDGIARAIQKGVYSSVQQAVVETVRLYFEGIQRLQAQYHLKVWIHPVTPPVNPKLTEKADTVARFNQQLALQFRESYMPLEKHLHDGNNFLRAPLNCDGTHLNASYLPLLQVELDRLPAPPPAQAGPPP